MSLFEELKRRNVIRVGTAYAVTAWLLIQVSETILPLFGFDASSLRLVVIVLAIGFVLVITFSWAFELTPEGLKRESEVDRSPSIIANTSKQLDRLIMVVLTLALGYFAFDKFVLDPSRDAAREAEVALQARSDALVESYGDKSIAVMPFADMSPDKDQEYFSDGLAEELINLLAKIPGMRVISRSSAFSFKDQSMDIPSIAKQLQVSHILEGSVRKAGDQVRITVQLIDAASDTHLWSETYDRKLNDIFAIQDEISAQVVAQLKLTLLGSAPSTRQTSPEAFALFLQARYLLDRFTPDSLTSAALFYQQALELDPDYPPALKGLAEIYANQAGWGLVPFQEAIDASRELVNRALAIDPLYADAYSGLGSFAQYYDSDMKSAATFFEKAVELGPNQASIIGDAGVFALNLGRVDQAIALFERQLSLDPVSPTAHEQLAQAYNAAGRFEQAVSAFQTVLNLSPDRIGAQYGLGVSLIFTADLEAALQAMHKEAYQEFRLAGLALVHHALGQTAESDTALEELTAQYAWNAAYRIAVVHAFRNDIESAFEWLERAEEINDTGLSGANINLFLSRLNSDSRWQALLERLGTSEQQLAAIKFEPDLPD